LLCRRSGRKEISVAGHFVVRPVLKRYFGDRMETRPGNLDFSASFIALTGSEMQEAPQQLGKISFNYVRPANLNSDQYGLESTMSYPDAWEWSNLLT